VLSVSVNYGSESDETGWMELETASGVRSGILSGRSGFKKKSRVSYQPEAPISEVSQVDARNNCGNFWAGPPQKLLFVTEAPFTNGMTDLGW